MHYSSYAVEERTRRECSTEEKDREKREREREEIGRLVGEAAHASSQAGMES